MLMLCAIVGGLLCLTCFMLLVVHPLVCIFECALSKSLSGSQKAIWIAITFFTGAFGSVAYALFGGSSPKLRSISLTGLKLGTVNLVLAIGVFACTPQVREFFNSPFGDVAASSMAFEIDNGFDTNASAEDFESAMADLDGSLSTYGSLSSENDESDVAFELATNEGSIFDTATKEDSVVESATFEDTSINDTSIIDTVEQETVEQETVERGMFVGTEQVEANQVQQNVDTASKSPEDHSDLSEEARAFYAMLAEEGDIDSLTDEPSALWPEGLETSPSETVQSEQDIATTTEQSPVDDSLLDTLSQLFPSDSVKAQTTLVEQSPAVSILEPEAVVDVTVSSTPTDATRTMDIQPETQRADIHASQPNSRDAKTVRTATPSFSAKPKPINRYRVEGYPVYEVNMPQTPTVRNRYTNQ